MSATECSLPISAAIEPEVECGLALPVLGTGQESSSVGPIIPEYIAWEIEDTSQETISAGVLMAEPNSDPSPDTEEPVHTENDTVAAVPRSGRLERAFGWIRRNKIATVAGAITVASLAAHPMGETVDKLGEIAPYVVPGMAAAEAVWIGGAAMMLASIGKKVWNPFKIRSKMGEIPEHAANSMLFKAGFVVNTAAAVAEFAIPAVAVTTKMPIESWGILSFSTIDLWATVVLRRLIWRGVHKKSDD